MTRPWRDTVALTYLTLQDNEGVGEEKFEMKNSLHAGQCDTVANDL